MQKQEDVIAEKKASKRRHSSAEIRRTHVERWKQSGLSMREYCREQGLSLSSFSSWAQTVAKSNVGFKPVTVSAAPILPERQANVVEIIVDNRIKIRLLNIIEPLLVITITKELMKCSS